MMYVCMYVSTKLHLRPKEIPKDGEIEDKPSATGTAVWWRKLPRFPSFTFKTNYLHVDYFHYYHYFFLFRQLLLPILTMWENTFTTTATTTAQTLQLLLYYYFQFDQLY